MVAPVARFGEVLATALEGARMLGYGTKGLSQPLAVGDRRRRERITKAHREIAGVGEEPRTPRALR